MTIMNFVQVESDRVIHKEFDAKFYIWSCLMLVHYQNAKWYKIYGLFNAEIEEMVHPSKIRVQSLQERIVTMSKCMPQQSIKHWKIGGHSTSFVAMFCWLHSITNMLETSLLESGHCRKWGRKSNGNHNTCPNSQSHTESKMASILYL